MLLWVAAFEHLGDDRFLARARAEAHTVRTERSPVAPTLCCGTIGRAYAFLALHRVSPGAGWYARAQRIATELVDASPAYTHPSGPLQGYPGLVFLARDRVRPGGARGFPFVEAIPI